MGRGTRTVKDQFSGVFGNRRGLHGAHEKYKAPACPEGGHQEVAVLHRSKSNDGGYWSVGWYGSDMTFTFWLDREKQALWQRHWSATRGERYLSHDDPHAHMRLAWEDLPEEVQARIAHEVSLGIHPLSGSTNDSPLNPF